MNRQQLTVLKIEAIINSHVEEWCDELCTSMMVICPGCGTSVNEFVFFMVEVYT